MISFSAFWFVFNSGLSGIGLLLDEDEKKNDEDVEKDDED